MSTMTEIEMIEQHAENIRNGLDEKVKPGMDAYFTEACVEGEGIWQGDLLLVIAGDTLGEGFGKNHAQEDNHQLVPGETVGSRHCLENLDGIEVFYPKEWNEDSLIGPYFTVAKGTTAIVTHPTHGNVHIPGGFNIQCYYQKEQDREQEKVRRALD